jgi:hypothetical protein
MKVIIVKVTVKVKLTVMKMNKLNNKQKEYTT